jgi:DNA polymerase I-like protein with 3'-5' exonuclease and polymerase domains
VTGWKAPDNPPNLSSAVMLGVDTETYDPELMDAGPGWARHKGHIVGVSIAAVDRLGNRGKWYFPMRHTVEPQDNLDPTLVMPWLKTELEKPIPKIGANFLYDMGWLLEEGINLAGPLHDVQFAEAIIDNNARVALETLGLKYLNEGKVTDLLEEWIEKAYKPKIRRWRGDIYRSPPRLVGPYAEGDADMPLRIITKQWETIARENMGVIYDLEHGLLPMLVGMRMKGVRVDVEKAMLLKEELGEVIEAEYLAIQNDYGMLLESTDSRQLSKLLDKLSISYPRTKADGPSITKPWLDQLQHPIGTRLNDLREAEKMVGTFLQSYIIDKNINGRLFPQFHPLRGEANGTMLGRFASSDPNLQNVPSRTELGSRVREVFIPDEGDVCWHKKDHSQIHYRLLADLAVDRGDGSADALRKSYNDDPHMDYHMKVYRDVAPRIGWPVNYVYDADGKIMADDQPKEIKTKRRITKNVNFSLIYGVGETTLRYKYLGGMSEEEIKAFFRGYYQGASFVQPTMEAIEFEAERNEYVTSVLGRRIRFDKWEPQERHSKDLIPLKRDQAIDKWGSMIRLAFLYRSINYKIQSSEPDVMKTGMLRCYESGVFNVTGLPSLTVHDELNWSKKDHSKLQNEAYAFITHTMEQAVKIRVPLIVDSKEGPNWSACG